VLQSGSSLVMVPQGSAARILILGDAGVGKSSFMYLLCHDGETLKRPHYTVGCDVDVLLHQSSEQATFFELVEVGGSPAFEYVTLRMLTLVTIWICGFERRCL
jgi:GTPase SAR1 family protein